jgi:lipoprotein signal peptidase
MAGGADQPPDEPAASRPSAPGVAPSRPRRRLGVVFGVAAAVLAGDIISKTIVVATLSDRHCLVGGFVPSPAPIRLLGGVLTLCESRNPGAAFGIGGASTTIVFTAIALGVIAFIIRTSRQIYSMPWAVALGLLLGGATGNLTDRIFRAPGPFRGWVVDWIQLPHWPVFNLADSSITCGVVLFVLLAARGHRLDGTTHLGAQRPARERSAADHQAAEPAVPQQPTGPAQPEKRRQQHPSGGGGG